MHIHLPKPLHGWREFVGEVGIIVIGVLIALGAEQLLENMHWREKVAQTREQLRLELHGDSASAYQWLTVRACLASQLDAAEAAVGAARESGAIAPVPAYKPPLVMFTSDAWLNARSLQVADHIGPEAMHHYAFLYFFPRELETNIVQLHQLAAELRPLAGGLRRVSAEEAGSYQRLLGRIRELQDRTQLAETLLLREGESSDTALSLDERRKAVAWARKEYGGCAAAPDLKRLFVSGH